MAEKKPRRQRAPQTLGYVCYVLMPDRGPVPVNELTPEEKEQWHANMRRRLTENMSDYYTQHPDEWQKMIDAGIARELTPEQENRFSI